MTRPTSNAPQATECDVVHKGLRYVRHSDAFLSTEEAEYALEALWERCAGTAAWSGPPAVDLPALSRTAVDSVFDLPAGQLPWTRSADVEPGSSRWALNADRLPMPFAASKQAPGYEATARFPLDLVAATFLMLTRWEETHRPAPRDEWGNYHSSNSLAARQDFLDRPIIDEWAIVLRSWLEARQPRWSAAPSRTRLVMTHDIDHPHLYRTPRAIARECGKALLRKRNPMLAGHTLAGGIHGFFAPDTDPYSHAVDALMDLDESLGTRGIFFFMAADKGPFDEGYELGSPAVRRMLDRIQERGHEIGWHPGYQAAEDQACFDRELKRFTDVLGATPRWVRHHYLRWQGPSTWRRLAEAGIRVDSTLGYNETVGFRCGTCLPFQTWDLSRGRRLELSEQPLIVEDVSLFNFQNCDQHSASKQIRAAWNRVQRVGGCLVALIHNSQSRELETVLASFHDGLKERSEICADSRDSPLAA